MKYVDVDFHFENIHAASFSEDGKHLILQVTGATGISGISIPASEVPRIVAMLMSVAGQAMKVSGDKMLRSMAIRQIKVLRTKKSDKEFLSVSLGTDTPPLVLDMSEKQLVDFARGILEMKGLIPSPRRGRSQ